MQWKRKREAEIACWYTVHNFVTSIMPIGVASGHLSHSILLLFGLIPLYSIIDTCIRTLTPNWRATRDHRSRRAKTLWELERKFCVTHHEQRLDARNMHGLPSVFSNKSFLMQSKIRGVCELRSRDQGLLFFSAQRNTYASHPAHAYLQAPAYIH